MAFHGDCQDLFAKGRPRPEAAAFVADDEADGPFQLPTLQAGASSSQSDESKSDRAGRRR
jgi:hypothetical protein